LSTELVSESEGEKLLTAAEVKRAFVAQGETISGWARKHGINRDAVYAVLNGRTKGKHGMAHQIAVLLGIKADPSNLSTTRLATGNRGQPDGESTGAGHNSSAWRPNAASLSTPTKEDPMPNK